MGGSTCCEVVLKYRERYGRRKVGGSVDCDILVSKMDFRAVLLNIVGVGQAIPRNNAGFMILSMFPRGQHFQDD